VKGRIVAGVSAGWVIVAAIVASQAVLEGAMLGNAVTASAAIRSALIQIVPWIPVTLAVIALATRFPVNSRTWRRHLPIHLLALVAFVWIENVLVVTGYWLSQSTFNGFVTLAREGARWAILRAHIAVLVYAAVAGVTQGIAYYRAARSRELNVARLESQLARARLDALNAQIRPHFLFNTLHTIGQLWRSGHADEADAVLDHLGALFQRVRQSTERPLVSLREELDMVLAYLAIEKARFRDRMTVEIDADDDALDCAVPPLLLQPIVENAVRHGIARTSDSGRIDVRARIDNGSLFIHVEDDGPGPAGACGGNGTNGGTGLANTRERLAQLFGSNQRLEIAARLPAGTRVTIVVPATSTDTEGDDAGSRFPRDG